MSIDHEFTQLKTLSQRADQLITKFQQVMKELKEAIAEMDQIGGNSEESKKQMKAMLIEEIAKIKQKEV